jgi:predicted nucleic acid-binding Zn ribbon protein
MGTGERRGLRTRTLLLLLVVVLIAIWYVGRYV